MSEAPAEDPRPVLCAIRELLCFKDATTISEVARIAGVAASRVLEIVNRNGAMVHRDRRTGKIVKVDPRAQLREKLWNEGKFYRVVAVGLFCKEYDGLDFKGHAELRQRLQTVRCIGALGDNRNETFVLDTSENRAALEAVGMQDAVACEIDDRLWKE